jgi:hypothetical protein
MMDTKKTALCLGFLLVACGATFVTHAQPVPKEPLARVTLIDAKSPSAAAVIAEQPIASGTLRFYRLSSPISRGVECCVNLGEGAAQSSVLRYEGTDTLAVAAQAATFDKPLDEGFVGLALAGTDVRVRRINTHKVSVSWKRHRGKVDVEHCLSREGVHVRLSHAGDRVHYYLPLGATVEPNCPASMVQ